MKIKDIYDDNFLNIFGNKKTLISEIQITNLKSPISDIVNQFGYKIEYLPVDISPRNELNLSSKTIRVNESLTQAQQSFIIARNIHNILINEETKESKKMQTSDLHLRMKNYEKQTSTFLNPDEIAVIRLDGVAFHTYTKGLSKPFDKNLEMAMKETMVFLCNKIPGCKFGYTQSDEITLIVQSLPNSFEQDLDKQKEFWFKGNVQKLTSISAALCTFKFNELMYPVTNTMALFDSRVFTVPDYVEAGNCVYWRQVDAQRNSVQMLGQQHLSHKALQGLSIKDLKEVLSSLGKDWNNLPSSQKWGSFAKRTNVNGINIFRCDTDSPILKDNWSYFYQIFNK